MDVSPGNEGSDAPQLSSPLSRVAPARRPPGTSRRRRHRPGPAARPGLARLGAAARLRPPLRRLRRRGARRRSSSSSARAGCSPTHDPHPNLLVVAALIFPLVFRRRAPMTVFLIIAAVAFVQWLVTGPALADVSLLVAMYTVAVESAWILVALAAAILEAGVVMATVRWTPTGNDSSPSSSSPASPSRRCWPASSSARCAASSTGWPSAPPASRSSATSRRRSPPRPSAPASPARCTTSSRTTSRSW